MPSLPRFVEPWVHFFEADRCNYLLTTTRCLVKMGDMFKQAIFDEEMRSTLHGWAKNVRKRKRAQNAGGVSSLKNFFTSRRKKDDKPPDDALEADASSQGAWTQLN